MGFTSYLVALALAFWTPLNGGVNPCPNGVKVDYAPIARLSTQDRMDAKGRMLRTLAEAPVEKGACEITFREGWLRHVDTPERAALLVVHELGHSAMGLEHQRGGVMTPVISDVKVPGLLYEARKVAPRHLFKRERFCRGFGKRARCWRAWAAT